MDFIDIFTKHTADLESPLSYIRWSAVAILSAVMRDNLYYQWTHGKIYPNIYVVIVAKSSATRKDPPIREAERFLRAIGNTKVISGRASIQAVMKVLAENYVDKDTNKRLRGAVGILMSKELSDFLVDDPVATKILTDWYDCHDIWPNNLISSGITELRNLCVTMLAASNDELFKDVFHHREIYGGLLARSFIITESRRRKKNSRMYADPEQENHEEELLQHLTKISSMYGQVELTENAKRLYDDWYNSIEDEHYDKAGVIARMHTCVLKLAMILAASHFSFDKVIHMHDVVKAIEWIQQLIRNYQTVMLGTGRCILAEPTTLVLQELMKVKNYQLTYRQLIQRLFGNVDGDTLQKVLKDLCDTGFLRPDGSLGEPRYTLTEKFFEHLENKIKEREEKHVI